MFNILIIIVMTVIVALSAAFAGMTFLQGVRGTAELQITKQRLLDVATQVQANARYINNVYALPAGATGSAPYAYNQVPSWISTNAKSASGVPFVYCPYSSATGSGSTITSPSGANNYAVTIANSATTNSRDYVVASAAMPAALPVGTKGVLIAAAPQNYNPPDCVSITQAASDSYTPIVSGGIVMPIQDNYLNKMQVPSAMTDLKLYVATAASGDSSGRDTSNYTTMTGAMTIINALKPATATIYVTASTSHATTSNFSLGTRISLTGLGSAPTGTAVTVTGGTMNLDEYSFLNLTNITLCVGAGYPTCAGTLNVYGTIESQDTTGNGVAINAGTMNIYGGRVAVSKPGFNIGNINIDGGGKLIIGSGSTAVFSNVNNRGLKILNGGFWGGSTTTVGAATTSIVPVFIGAGGNFFQGLSGTTTIGTSGGSQMIGGVVIDPGGHYYNRGTQDTIFNKVSGYGFYVHGELDLQGTSNVYYRTLGSGLTNGIVLASGGALDIYNVPGSTTTVGLGESGSKPTVGIQDSGGSLLAVHAGAAQNIYATTSCWLGNASTDLFDDSAVGTPGSGNVASAKLTAGYKGLAIYNASAYLTCP